MRFTDMQKRFLILLVLAGLIPGASPIGPGPMFAAAIERDDLEGTVYIEGDQNEAIWDDDGISSWEAEGNVYLRFTSTDGNIFELWGDRLVYTAGGDSPDLREHVVLEGNIKLGFDGNTLTALYLEGWLDPLYVDVTTEVKLTADAFTISCEKLALIESTTPGEDEPVYVASTPAGGSSEITFYRDVEKMPQAQPEPLTRAIPLPVDINPDFNIVTMEAPGFSVVFKDEEILGAEFPDGADAVTDTDYFISHGTLSMHGMDEFTATACRIIGLDVTISCDEMKFYPDRKYLDLIGSVNLISDEGSLVVDSLSVLYDDNGVKELRASGNVRLDFSVLLEGSAGDETSVDLEKQDSGGNEAE